jgi:hypothetical protein
VSEQNSVGPTRLRHGIGVGEVFRYCSDTVSESERCSDTIPTRCRSSIGVGEVLRYGVGARSEQNINKFTFYSAFHSAYIQLLIKGIHIIIYVCKIHAARQPGLDAGDPTFTDEGSVCSGYESRCAVIWAVSACCWR